VATTAPVAALTAATIIEDTHLTLVEGQAGAELDRARAEFVRAQAAIQMAQAVRADLDAPDLPEPPEPPEPPELPGFSMLPDIGAIVDGAMGQVYALGGSVGGNSAAPLIVAGQLDATQQSEFTEDLAVMHRILLKAATKASGGSKGRTAMGIRLQFPFGQTGPSSLYLEDYGAVFFLNVNYPLVAPPAEGEPKAAPDKPTDTTWEEARAELYGAPPGRRSTGLGMQAGATTGNQLEYDPGRVGTLKAALIEVAKNTANIRHLKPNEYIVVVVQGTGQPNPKRPDLRHEDRSGPRGPGKTALTPTVLTIRFKKADAEATAQGKLSPEDFAKTTVVWSR